MLSLYLQEENINFTTLPGHVKQTTDCLHSLIATYQHHMNDLSNSETEFAKCQELFDEVTEHTDLQLRMREPQEPILTPASYLEMTGNILRRVA